MRRLEIRRNDHELLLEWPLWPRIGPYVGALAVGCVWPVLGFPLASALGLEQLKAVAFGFGPSMLLLVVAARPLADELRRKRIVVRRVAGGIAIGALAPLPGGAFTIDVRERRRPMRKPAYEVRLLAPAKGHGRTFEAVLVAQVLGTREEAEVLAGALRDFIGGPGAAA